MATPTRTNERPGTRAVLRHYRMSASKARQVLDLVRGKDVLRAQEILAATPREAAAVVSKVLSSAVANAANNDGQAPDELFITSAYADEGSTLKRYRPRARGRAGRIRKRSCHITVIVARMDEPQLERARATRTGDASARARRVAGSRRRADQQSHAHRREVDREEAAAAAAAAEADEAAAEAALAGEDEEAADAADETATDAAGEDAADAEATDVGDDDEAAADEAGEEQTD
jgi:large subunit ribosomal protein L22